MDWKAFDGFAFEFRHGSHFLLPEDDPGLHSGDSANGLPAIPLLFHCLEQAALCNIPPMTNPPGCEVGDMGMAAVEKLISTCLLRY